MKISKKNRNRILVVIVVVVVIIVVARLISISHGADKTAATETRMRLEALADQDIAPIQDAIDSERTLVRNETVTLDWSADLPSVEEARQYNYKDIFSDCILKGHSNTVRLVGFDYLTQAEVIAKTGSSMTASDDQLQEAAAMSPRMVFLSYGTNDISHAGYDFDLFRERFDDFLTRAEAALPNTMIYVNLIFPVRSPLLEEQPYFADIDTFNEIVKEVCDEHEIPWLDQTEIVKEEYYESDGYHFTDDFYPLWLYCMAKEVGLI